MYLKKYAQYMKLQTACSNCSFKKEWEDRRGSEASREAKRMDSPISRQFPLAVFKVQFFVKRCDISSQHITGICQLSHHQISKFWQIMQDNSLPFVATYTVTS